MYSVILSVSILLIKYKDRDFDSYKRVLEYSAKLIT